MPPKAPPVAKPTKSIFDPFNSSATGHQRADNSLSGSTSWRDSRHKKLREQFSAGAGGGKRVRDTVGAGSLDFGKDGRTENGGWERGAAELRVRGQQSLWESLKVTKDGASNNGHTCDTRPAKRIKTDTAPAPAPAPFVPTSVGNPEPFAPVRNEDGSVRESTGSWPSAHANANANANAPFECSPSDLLEPIDPPDSSEPPRPKATATGLVKEGGHSDTGATTPVPPQIFNHLCFYINGCTAPVGDHKLKHMISIHGGHMSIALGRRTVTHVVLGKPNANGAGCGGGLAGSKIHKEITQIRGKSIKFITAEWVTESISAGKRLPESRFAALKLAPRGVASIDTMLKPKEKA